MKRSNLISACIALCGAMLMTAPGLSGQAPRGGAPAAAPRGGAPAAAPRGPGPGPAPAQRGAPGATQRPMVSCQRGGLQYAVRLYLGAQASGNIADLPLASGLGYWEDMKAADVNTGFLTKKLVVDRSLSLYDDQSCQTYTEIIVTNAAEPYVAGVRMRVNHDKIAEIEVITSTTGYWGFNVDNFFKYSSDQNWSAIPADKRDTRGTLVNAGNAYLDAFLEAKIDLVPWGYPCERIEGGMFTGNNSADVTCEAGVPPNVNIANRRFVVDEVLGAVVVWCTFGAGGPTGGSGAPDTHMFRVEKGKLRYVHTITHLLQNAGPGRGAGGGAAPPRGGAPGGGGPGAAPGAGRGAAPAGQRGPAPQGGN